MITTVEILEPRDEDWNEATTTNCIYQSLFFLVLPCGTTQLRFISVENCQEVYDTLVVLAFRHLYRPALRKLAG